MRRSTDTAFEPESREDVAAPWGPQWSAEGVIATLEPLSLDRRKDKLQRVIAARIESVTVVMDAPHDPHNGAAVMRSCEAFGVQTLHIVERREPFLAARTVSKGTERWLDVIRHRNTADAINRLAAERFELAVAHPEGQLLPEDLARIPRVALVMGNETNGVCDELTAASRLTVRVPMRGFVESLNVSVTTALLLAAATRDRPGDLDEERRTFLYARALLYSVPRAHSILHNLPPR